MTLILREIAKGKWYKFGVGAPTEATQEEVSLWKSAQAEVTNAVAQALAPQIVETEDPSDESEKEKSAWDRVMDLAKWAAFLVAAATFVTLYVDWQFLNGLYGEFGAAEIVFDAFSTNPIHYAGIDYLTDTIMILSLGVFICILIAFPIFFLIKSVIFIASNVLKWIYRAWNRESASPGKRASKYTPGFTAMVLMYIALWISIKSVATNDVLGDLASLSFLVAGALSFSLTRIPREAKRPLLISFLAIIGLLSFRSILTEGAQQAGREEALAIRRGRRVALPYVVSTPGVALVANNRQLVSEMIQAFETPDGDWAYWPKRVYYSGVGAPIPSLQYLGGNDETIYLLDLGHFVTHAIPRDDILELVFFPPEYPESREFSAILPQDWTTSIPTDTVPAVAP